MQTPQIASSSPPSSHRWSRFARWTPRPVRIMHRGSPAGHSDWQHVWAKYGAYGLDSCITAAVRPLAGPFIGCRDALAASEGQSWKKRTADMATGSAKGLVKGIGGCAVSLGVAGVCLAESAMFGIGAGCYKLAHPVSRPNVSAPDPHTRAPRPGSVRNYQTPSYR